MGASRVTQNLFLYIKRKDFRNTWYYIKHFNKTTYVDTVVPILCKFFGHKPYHHPNFDTNEYACKRCNRYIEHNLRLEKLKRLNKINK